MVLIPGSVNIVADALSQPPQATSMYLRCHESDYKEDPLSQSIDDHEKVIGPEKINKDSTLQKNTPKNLAQPDRNSPKFK